MSKFKTTILTSQSEYLERGSRFIGYLKPIESAADFKNFLKNIRKEHKSSSHVCNAYRFFSNKILEEKGADDGEPSGSAGLPILNELKRCNLVNVGAFVVRYFGGKKLCPSLSPNKTWSGFIFGILLAILTSIICYYIKEYSLLNGLIFGLILAVFTQFGDLFESWVKRKHSIKDSGKFLPGHGGVLDRLDGLMLSSLILYIGCIFYV